MKINGELFKNWFGYTRRERRSAIILLLITVLIISLRYIVPDSNIEIESYAATTPGIVSASGSAGGDLSFAVQKHRPEVHTASYEIKVKSAIASAAADNSLINNSDRERHMQSENSGKVWQKPEIDINRCDSAVLVTLPGIGPVLSARIVKYRRLLGGFARVDQLKEVFGLPEETYNLIKSRLYADSSSVSTIKVNSADYRELVRLPYFEKFEVTAILKYRELEGRINSLNELIDNKLITEDKARKVGPYLNFEH